MIEILFWILLWFVGFTAIGGFIAYRVAVKWTHEALELEQYGVAATGRVTEKRRRRQRHAWSTWIRYEYIDAMGQTHRSRRYLVTPEAWESHVEGGPIDIVYSQRRPRISAPKYLLALKTQGRTPRS